MSARIEDLEPKTQALCRQFLTATLAAGYPLRVTHTLRTMDEQAKLYAQGRTMPGPIVTNAKPGQSPHNFGMGFDFCFEGPTPYPDWRSPLWAQVGAIGTKLGLSWGGNWTKLKDRDHFELPGWKDLSKA